MREASCVGYNYSGKKVPVTLRNGAILGQEQTFAILVLYGQTVEPRANKNLNQKY